MVKRKRRPARPRLVSVPALVPVLKPVLKPIIEPVVVRLDQHENLLLEMKSTLDVQFQRIAAIQAQLDHLLAKISRS